jgi:hypothetical protein
MQHAPVGGGAQVVVSQMVPGPCQTPPAAVQSASVFTWQVVPFAPVMQHAPVGFGAQVMAAQVVPGPCQTPPPAVQSARVLMVQRMAPVAGVQQAPVGAVRPQMLAVLQEVLSPL